jgi:valyl-tRNA synthetase
VHERCKKEIEYLMLPQWFLRILPLKQELIQKADEISWYPYFMKSRYINWVENLSWDWCLSRQRFYGIPFPAWHCTTCEEIILASPEQLPIDPQETPAPRNCLNCPESTIVPDTDVMDTWNTSSLTPYICLSLYQKDIQNIFSDTSFIPMSMRPQAHDIIRTWAFYTIVKTLLHQNSIPWRTIEISKSQENSPLAPENLLKLYPADVIRYWTASGTLGHDVAFSESQLAIGQKLLVKLWNAFKFAQQYLAFFDPIHRHVIQSSLVEQFGNILPSATQEALIETYAQHAIPESKLTTVNAWILHQASATFSSYQKYFEEHEISLALNAVEKFFWHDFCDNYIELIKDILMQQDKYSTAEVSQTLWTLYTVGLRILQLYAPFVPHITETLYAIIYKRFEQASSIHNTRYTTVHKQYTYPEEAAIMQKLLAIISTVRKLKTEHQLSLKTEITKLTVSLIDTQNKKLLQENEQLLKGITRAQEIEYIQTPVEQATLKTVEGNHYIFVAL